MDVTFQPTFYAMPYLDIHQQDNHIAVIQNLQPPMAFPRRPSAHNLLGSTAGDKRTRQLRLEQGFGAEPGFGMGRPTLEEDFPRRVRSNGSTVRVCHDDDLSYIEAPLRTIGETEDIGTFDHAEPIAAPPAFNVPKPGLKAAKKPASRGKGVPSSVLAADGSVTQQQASML
jgi:hypothetical protein